MEDKQFFRLMRYMGVYPNSRVGYRIYKSLYDEHVKKSKLQKIIKDIEESKKGPYYLIDYLMRQKQENIINRAINNRVRSRKYF